METSSKDLIKATHQTATANITGRTAMYSKGPSKTASNTEEVYGDQPTETPTKANTRTTKSPEPARCDGATATSTLANSSTTFATARDR